MKKLISILTLASSLAFAASKPNIILIMADDMGFETLSANGSQTFNTPNLDRLAAEGARFNHCYSQPLCTPSRVQIMTGKYNIRNYVKFGVLDRKEKTFAHYFKEQGYATCISGKWQLGKENDAPQHFGFDESCLWQHTRSARNENNRDTRYPNPSLEINGKPVDYTNGEYGPDVVTDFMCDFMERNKEKPFLAYYPMMLPHDPFVPTPDSADPKSRNKQQNFEDMVTYVDKMVGQLDAKLSELGIRENTLLIFTGDNGTSASIKSILNGKEIQGGKRQMTDAGTHVPLVASWPGTIKGGQVLDDLVDFSDMLPTMCDAAGFDVSAEPELDGRSFLPQLKGEKGNPRDWVYCWYLHKGTSDSNDWARNQRYKLYGSGRFYDISQDKLEKQPLTALSDEAKTAKAILQKGLDKYADARPADLAAGPKKKSAKKKRKDQKTRLPVKSDSQSDSTVQAGNVLLIMSDDLKASALPMYGDQICKTPNLDKFAARGLVFDRAYCQGLACHPSRPSMMRSLYPQSTQQAKTLGEHLKEHGIHSARVGKIFHMGVPNDPKRGTAGLDVPACWDEAHNTKSPETMTPGLYRQNEKGIVTREMEGRQCIGTRGRYFTSVEADVEDGSDQADYKVAEIAVRLLQERAKEDKPFFLGVGFFRPHYPMVAPEKYFDMYGVNDMKVPPQIPGDRDDLPEGAGGHLGGGLNEHLERAQRVWQAYYASTTFMDDQLGKVLDELERLGLSESTTIIFTTDHGYHLGEHGFWQKANLHEEVTRVPFIMAGPGVEKGRTKSFAELVDIFPTCMELFGLKIPEAAQGKSLIPVMADAKAKVRDAAFSVNMPRKPGGAVRGEDYSYMKYEGHGEIFYDMIKDPHQYTNEIDNPTYAEAIKKARVIYAKKMADFKIQWPER